MRVLLVVLVVTGGKQSQPLAHLALGLGLEFDNKTATQNQINSTNQKIDQQIKRRINISKFRAKVGPADKKLD